MPPQAGDLPVHDSALLQQAHRPRLPQMATLKFK
jgi:hypothetical protein